MNLGALGGTVERDFERSVKFAAVRIKDGRNKSCRGILDGHDNLRGTHLGRGIQSDTPVQVPLKPLAV